MLVRFDGLLVDRLCSFWLSQLALTNDGNLFETPVALAQSKLHQTLDPNFPTLDFIQSPSSYLGCIVPPPLLSFLITDLRGRIHFSFFERPVTTLIDKRSAGFSTIHFEKGCTLVSKIYLVGTTVPQHLVSGYRKSQLLISIRLVPKLNDYGEYWQLIQSILLCDSSIQTTIIRSH